MKPIQVDFKPSVVFIFLFILASLAACVLLVLMPLTWQIKSLLVLVVVIFSSYTILYHGLLCLPASIVSLTVNIKNELHLVRKDGQHLQATVAGNTTVTPYLTVLNYRLHHSMRRKQIFNHSLIILPDSAEVETLRQLRVWLRWGKVAI